MNLKTTVETWSVQVSMLRESMFLEHFVIYFYVKENKLYCRIKNNTILFSPLVTISVLFRNIFFLFLNLKNFTFEV